ncbi:MAG: DoxX family protein [Candidatus Cybelea sp.]
MRARSLAQVLLGLFFIAAGANHFVHRDFYLRIVPGYLPDHALLVAISGVCECLGGIGVLIPRTRKVAGIGLIALLIAVLPANAQMAQHPELYRDIGSPAAFLIRLPLQVILIFLVWWACRPVPPSSRPQLGRL